jgi:hypothetical protein
MPERWGVTTLGSVLCILVYDSTDPTARGMTDRNQIMAKVEREDASESETAPKPAPSQPTPIEGKDGSFEPYFSPATCLMYPTGRIGNLAWSHGHASLVSISMIQSAMGEFKPEGFAYLIDTYDPLAKFIDTNPWWVSAYPPAFERFAGSYLEAIHLRQRRILDSFLFAARGFRPDFKLEVSHRVPGEPLDCELATTFVHATIEPIDFTFAESELRREILHNLTHPLTLYPRETVGRLLMEIYFDILAQLPANSWEFDRDAKLQWYRTPRGERKQRDRCPLRLDPISKCARYKGREIASNLEPEQIAYLTQLVIAYGGKPIPYSAIRKGTNNLIDGNQGRFKKKHYKTLPQQLQQLIDISPEGHSLKR